MEISFTPEDFEVVRQAIAAGRVHDPEEAMYQAKAQWIENERKRAAFIQSLDDAEASLARGEGRRIATEADRLALVADINRRGHARLAAERQAGN